MSDNDSEFDALKRALDNDWPEIQRHLIGEGAGLDSWWLDRFERKDVLLELPGVVIMNTRDWHVDGVVKTLEDTYGYGGYDCDDCFRAAHISVHIERFPEGQFVGIRISGPNAGHAIAMASTMRTSRPPTAPVLPWGEAIGDLTLSAHQPEGDWLYGVELAVRPMYRRKGIGKGLYQARFDLVKSLNLRGWCAVGMLMGYQAHAHKMNVVEYGEKVIARQIKDPTVTMQMNRGFRAGGVITDYVDEPAAGNAGVLIVWENPNYAAGEA